MLSCLVNGAYKISLVANKKKVVHVVVTAGSPFLAIYLVYDTSAI